MLYAFGSNGSGQLGLGHQDDTSRPQRASLPEDCDSEVVKITAGGNHTLILDLLGRVYATGENGDGRCGLPPTAKCITKFSGVGLPNDKGISVTRFDCICATWEASVFVTHDGQVYTSGTGNKGELGQGNEISQSPVPKALRDFPPRGARVVDIAACISHAVAVLSNGDVYGWGNSRKGQLGKLNASWWTPTKIEDIPFRAARAICGKDFTIILGSPETGCYRFLGLDKYAIQQAAPPILPVWKDVGASWNGLYVLLHSGELLAWGRDDHGQLPPQDIVQIDKMAIGSEHVIAKTKRASVIAWGWSEHGNCGFFQPRGMILEDGSKEILVSNGNSDLVALGAGCATSWICVAASRESDV